MGRKREERAGAGQHSRQTSDSGDARPPASHRRREAKLRMPPGCSEALLSLLVTHAQPPRAPRVSLHPTTLRAAMTGHAGPEAKKPAASERRGFSREIQGPKAAVAETTRKLLSLTYIKRQRKATHDWDGGSTCSWGAPPPSGSQLGHSSAIPGTAILSMLTDGWREEGVRTKGVEGGLLEAAPNISTSTPMYRTASHSANRGRRTWNSEQSPWTGVERGERKNQKEHRKLGPCPQAIPEVYQMHKVLAERGFCEKCGRT